MKSHPYWTSQQMLSLCDCCVVWEDFHNLDNCFPPHALSELFRHPTTLLRDAALLFFTRLATLNSYQATSLGSLPRVLFWQRRGLPLPTSMDNAANTGLIHLRAPKQLWPGVFCGREARRRPNEERLMPDATRLHTLALAAGDYEGRQQALVNTFRTANARSACASPDASIACLTLATTSAAVTTL